MDGKDWKEELNQYLFKSNERREEEEREGKEEGMDIQLERMICKAIKENLETRVGLLMDWKEEKGIKWNQMKDKLLFFSVSISLNKRNRFQLNNQREGKEENQLRQGNEIIQLILKRYNATEVELNECLLLVSSQSRLDVLQLLVVHAKQRNILLNFDVKDKENENTPLLLSTLHHNLQLQMVEYLLLCGANINATNKQKNNCLHRIASKPTINESIFQVVLLLISKGIQMHFQNIQGDTPLIKSARQGNIRLTRLFLKYTNREQLLVQNNSGFNVIHESSIWCQSAILQLISDQFSDVMNSQSNGKKDSPLHVAGDESLVGPGFYRGGTKISPINQMEAHSWMSQDSFEANSAVLQTIQVILNGGGSVHSLNSMNETPLHNMRVPWEKTRLLLSKFEDPFSAINSPNEMNKTPFQIAFELSKIEHVQHILEIVSGENSIDQESPKVVALIESVQSNLGSLGKVLRLSCTQETYFSLTKLLLSKSNGISLVNNADENGITCLHLSAKDNVLPTVRLLLQSNANPDLKGILPKEKAFEVDPLVVDKMIQAFGDHKTTPFSLDKEVVSHEKEKTPIEMAIDHFAIESAIEIVKHKYNDPSMSKQSKEAFLIKSKYDSSGNNFLHKAVETGSVEALIGLLEYVGLDPNSIGEDLSTYSDGGTPLHRAAQCDQSECASILLDWKADINSQSSFELNTPIHLACRFGNVDSVKLLLERGADPSVVNSEGENPLAMAEYGGSEICIGMIQTALAQKTL